MLNDQIRYTSGGLWCEGVALDAIAEATGTPVYVYSAGRVLANVQRLQAAFAPCAPSIHYSVKANANLALLRLLGQAGLGMDVVSAGEIYRAQGAGIDPARIVYAGVGKTREEMTYALAAGVGWFNVESEAELRLLDTLAGERGQVARVALRLNPGIHAQTHEHLATGHFGAKFGMPPDVVARLLADRAAFSHVHIAGLHVHIGSQQGDVGGLVAAVSAARALAAPYDDVRTLNIGGGFPVRYTEADSAPGLDEFAAALAPLVRGWQVIIEPGRALVADAGVLVIRVLYVKEQGGQRFVITDGSMTDLIRPALYGAVHPVVAVRYVGAPLEAQRDPGSPLEAQPITIVAGPVCESADVLNRDALLPLLAAGDRLAVLGVGAYGMVMASNYNQRVRPAEVLVEGDRWRVVRRRETWDDLLRLEQ